MKRSAEQVLDEFLVLRCQSGDLKSFESLVARHQSRLIRLAIARTGNQEAALDAVQETWAAALKSIRRLQDPARIRSWLDQIVRHKCTDWIRRQQRRRAHTAELQENLAGDEANVQERNQSRREEAIANIRSALRNLPEEQRLLLSRYYLDRWTIRQIAAALAIPQGTVKSRLFHAREKLKRVYEGESND